jgi:hypothetical protein
MRRMLVATKDLDQGRTALSCAPRNDPVRNPNERAKETPALGSYDRSVPEPGRPTVSLRKFAPAFLISDLAAAKPVASTMAVVTSHPAGAVRPVGIAVRGEARTGNSEVSK